MKAPEKFSYNYLIFRSPTEFLLVLIPFVTAVMINVFSQVSDEVDVFTQELIMSKQLDAIDDYMLAFFAPIVILMAFFVSYRWSTMQTEGGYGFWLTLGINRRKFFVRTVLKFLFLLYIGILLGMLTIFYLNQMYLEPMMFIILNLLILSHLLFITGVSILLGGMVKNPESAAIFYIILMGLNYVFNTDSENFLNMLFNSAFQYRVDTAWFSFFISLALALGVNFVALRMHTKFDMDL